MYPNLYYSLDYENRTIGIYNPVTGNRSIIAIENILELAKLSYEMSRVNNHHWPRNGHVLKSFINQLAGLFNPKREITNREQAILTAEGYFSQMWNTLERIQ